MGQRECIPGLKASAAESLRDEILRRLPHWRSDPNGC
jgi:hypothetical protein